MLSTIYIRANKLVGYLLGTTLSALVLLYLYLHRGVILNNKRWAAIIFLSVFSLFLLYLITAIKRFHERTLSEVSASLVSAVNDLKVQAGKIELLHAAAPCCLCNGTSPL